MPSAKGRFYKTFTLHLANSYAVCFPLTCLRASRDRSAWELVMALTIVSLIVVVAAIAVLVGCFRGFSRAARQTKVRGLLARVSCKQEEQTRLPDMPISATSKDHTTTVVSSLSKNT